MSRVHEPGQPMAMSGPPPGGLQSAWGRNPGRGSPGRGRGGHCAPGKNTPWGEGSASGRGRGAWGGAGTPQREAPVSPTGRGAWGGRPGSASPRGAWGARQTSPSGRGGWGERQSPSRGGNAMTSGPTPMEGAAGNRRSPPPGLAEPRKAAWDTSSSSSPQQGPWNSQAGTAAQSAAARKGSAPWKSRGTSSADPSSPETLEEAMGALNVGSSAADETQTEFGSQITASAASTIQAQRVSVNTRGCEFSNEPQALQQLHNQQHIQELGMLGAYDPETRDPSNTQLRIAAKQVWDEDKLEHGCRLLNEGVGKDRAARIAQVLKADLMKYWGENYAYSESDSDSDF